MDGNKAFLVIICFLCFFASTIDEGNSTEEFSLVPLFIALYITFKYYFETKKISPSEAFIVGLCFSFIFWMRLNNAGAISACCIFIFIACLLNKDYKSLKNLILYFIGGVVIFSIPIISYFLYYNAFSEMIYASYLFNISYVEESGSIFNFSNYIGRNLIVISVLLSGAILYYKKEKDSKLFLFACLLFIFNIAFANMGYAYKHYFILISFSMVAGSILLLASLNIKVNKYVIYALLGIASSYMVIRYVSKTKKYDAIRKEGTSYIDAGNELISKIPDNEKSRVYYYLVRPRFYPMLEISSNYKHFAHQEWMGSHNPDIYDEINLMLATDKPLWIMMEKSEFENWNKSENRNKEFRRILSATYMLAYENDLFLLYRFKR
ncbi:hypothetical protein [Dysgonomonas sp. 511]|uniref:hypothetical protein n=1 Tax=Dysgonomonas sp. 511 TaxID=2302930 RepID=UPI001C887FBD|nr:hypothetical protein [Dysgonomonas sp. 511]